jgi:hypothetical protein
MAFLFILVKTLWYKPVSRGFETRSGQWFLSIYLILTTVLGTVIYWQMSIRTWNKKGFCEIERGRCTRLTTWARSMSRFSTPRGIFNISQPYRPPRIVAGYVRFDFFTAVTMKNGVFWDVRACASCKNRRFAWTYKSHTKLHPRRRHSCCRSVYFVFFFTSQTTMLSCFFLRTPWHIMELRRQRPISGEFNDHAEKRSPQ